MFVNPLSFHQPYRTKRSSFSGSNFQEVHDEAHALYLRLKQKTKRRTHVRSKYFMGEKVFIDLFWHHLFEKGNWRDRVRRMKFFGCAIEPIQHSARDPISKENPNKTNEILHRFIGLSADGQLFYAQVKEDKRKGQKFLLSVFPEERPSKQK